MLVRSYMSQPPIVAEPGMPMADAMRTMRDRRIRRLPVVDRDGRLVGIVSERDLLHAEPSPATSLSVWEIGYLLAKITVREVMTREVITVAPETPVEDAARIMCERKIGGLPVVEGGRVVGVITETDVFRIFTLLLGSREPGVGVTASVIDRSGLLADITRAIAGAGGSVRAIATYPPDGPCGEAAPRPPSPPGAENQAGERAISLFVKVTGVPDDQLLAVIEPWVERIEEVRPAAGT